MCPKHRRNERGFPSRATPGSMWTRVMEYPIPGAGLHRPVLRGRFSGAHEFEHTEWKRYREQGVDFRSHLAVSMDGTCNGYQHLSAMGRDPIGGRATNLVPADDPQDIYQEVADHVSRRVNRDAENVEHNDKEQARRLIGKIDRAAVKHATMTTPYGVTRGTIYKELMETKPARDCEDAKACARYLARVLEECIPEVAVEAGNIMKWLRDVARALAKANRGMVWTTPAGFRVIHATRESKTQRIA